MPLLATDYLALLSCIALTILLCLCVLSKSKWLNALGYLVATAVFTIHILDSIFDYIWVWIIPHPAAVIPMLAGVWGPLIAILVGLARYIERRRDRLALYFICVLLAGYGCYAVGRQLVDPGVKAESWWRGEVLMQSTSTTCVAAACCTYLRTRGVEIDEAMAVRDGLISDNGGTQVQAWRILKLNLDPRETVRIAPLTLVQMGRTGHWYVVSIRYGPAEGHCVCARVAADNGDRYVVVRDPLIGEYTKSMEDFGEQWLGVGIWAEQPWPKPPTWVSG